jgi:Tfp pilus assembly protein PilF
LRRAVEADPAYLDGLVNLSLAHFRNDDMEQARVYSQKALALDPSNAPARRILAALDL